LEIGLDDLIAPLADGVNFGEVRKQLQSAAKREAMPDPVSEVRRSKEDRKAQYESSSREASKWIPQVQQMRRSDQIILDDGLDDRKVTSTGQLAGSFKPRDDFERDLEEVTRSARATEEDMSHARQLPVNARIRDARENQQVARLKALMLREQIAAKRLKKIKSKTYRRIHRRAEARERDVLLERLEHENPELAKHLRQDYAKQHAQRRLLRQRNARKKWAQTMQRFGKHDGSVRQEISKQASAARDEERSLKRAIRGQADDSDDEAGEVDLSDDDDDGGSAHAIQKAKDLTSKEIQKLVQGDSDLPTTGILGMNFMRNAIKQKREAARHDAEKVLHELEGLNDAMTVDDGAGKVAEAQAREEAPRQFSPEELAEARTQIDELMAEDDGGAECTVSGPLTAWDLGTKQGAEHHEAAAPQSANSSNPWLTAELPSAKPQTKTKKRRARQAEAARADQSVSPDEVLSALCAESDAVREQRDLVRATFIEGTQEEDFEQEMQDKKAAEDVEVDDRLVGWGSWAGDGIKKRRRPRDSSTELRTQPQRPAQKVQFTDKDALAKSGKYFVDKVPFPFQNAEQYNQQLKMPTGPEWNTLGAYHHKIKPKVFSKIGVVVTPLRYVKHLPADQRDSAIAAWAASKQPKRLKARF
jgi:U3 small nucleolar RNA-associated protein 14